VKLIKNDTFALPDGPDLRDNYVDWNSMHNDTSIVSYAQPESQQSIKRVRKSKSIQWYIRNPVLDPLTGESLGNED
jgi:hypothetical protein